MVKWKFRTLIFLALLSQAAHSAVSLNLPKSGWHRMPEIFAPYLSEDSRNLFYNADSKFLREFKKPYLGFHNVNYVKVD